VFYRMEVDGGSVRMPLEGQWGGVGEAACFLMGGGPSLASLPIERMAGCPVPRMAVNLAGARLIRPTFWTSYDPTARFHKSLYLDAGVIKFVHRRRAMDLVPETTLKVCECPATYCFDRDGQRGFHNFVASGQSAVVDWQDSLVQAIDILYRLGFRTIYLAGTEMRVRPSVEQIEAAAGVGVTYDPQGLLGDFVKACEAKGLSKAMLDGLPAGAQYHFGEVKPVASAVSTDFHYFRVTQYLRLSRRALCLAGLRLVSVTPGSRLNAFFPYRDCEAVIESLLAEVGDPGSEPCVGVYTGSVVREAATTEPMRDFRPHHWGKGEGEKREVAREVLEEMND
jgi:hypothetical protein